MENQTIYDAVTAHYSAQANSAAQAGAYGTSVAKSFGYTEEELATIPKESNLGLSCGNPLAIASLKEGETLIDFGSGAGFDIFLSSPRLGPSGRAIGIDMNASMLHRSRLNLAKLLPRQQANISFIESKITRVPLPADTADVIISNCVINLVPAGEKPLVFKEMFRLLKPGGRVALNDMLARQQLPAAVRESVALYAACIAGASLRADYEAYLRDAGFVDVVIADSGADVNVYAETGSDGEKKQKKNTACCNSMPMQGHQEGGRNGCRVAAGVAPGVAEKDDEPRCDGGKVESSCSNNETEQQKSCCVLGCSGKIETASLCGLSETLDGMDLNEWVGSCNIYAVKPFE